MSKKIMVLTGKRGGYGAMRPMLRLLEADPDFDLCLVATDMHLRYEFGHTIDEIQKDFPDIKSITLHDTGHGAASRVWALGELQSEMSITIEIEEPDCLILFGDRGESLVAAVAALHMNIPIAHIQGGDRTGNMDDKIRFAISSMATYHFASCEDSADTLEHTVLNPESIYLVGDLHIDPIIQGDWGERLTDRPGIIVVIYHPETGPGAFDPAEGMNEIINSVCSLKEKRLVFIYPCSDPGYKDVVKVLESLPPREDISILKNMEQDDFLTLLSRAEVIVGNSSCGIIEAPYFNLPTVNVGNRQRGRLQCRNVVNCKIDSIDIGFAIISAMELKCPFDKKYGDGHAGERIVGILRKVL